MEALLAGCLAAIVAQILKFIFYTILNRKIDFRVFTTTGGMPSSHSAGVVALSTAIGIQSGFMSQIFAVSMGFAFVVMYDAAGIRRASGKMAVCLNKIMDDFYKHDINAAGTKLKELLGHTPVEVFCGAILGVLFAFYFHYIVLL
ncbi:divergent PAP2 family protein [bacterium]|nr:divergent PAP2 family protein [bacterium]